MHVLNVYACMHVCMVRVHMGQFVYVYMSFIQQGFSTN